MNVGCATLVIHIMTQWGYPHAPKSRYAKRLAKFTCKYAKRYQIHPQLVQAIQHTETRFRHFTKPSKTNDYGVQQVHCPRTNYAPWCRDLKRLIKLEYNIKTGIRILYLKKRACVGKHKHKSPWYRHYNWLNKRYYKVVQRKFNAMKKEADAYKARASTTRDSKETRQSSPKGL